MGYAQAGFKVVGVDKDPQKNYPFEFIEADALSLDPGFIASFDAIHASPPCQGYTALRHAPGTKGAPQLIDATRTLLEASGRPWIIENVEQARWALRDPILLCGSMFALGAQGHQLQRHRLFESSIPLTAPACQHSDTPVIGIYGGHARCRSLKHGGRGTKDSWIGGHRAASTEAMGMDWGTLKEISEAIPPAYTKFLGAQILDYIGSAV